MIRYRAEWLNLTTPKKVVDDEEVHDGCKRYSFNFSEVTAENIDQFLNDGVPSPAVEGCSNWEYDTSLYKSSIVTDVSA